MITVSAKVKAPLAKVWECWTTPEHIKGWCFASDDWEVGDVSNDVRTGGHFSTIMRAKDGSASFDFNGDYAVAEEMTRLEYAIEGGRKVSVTFLEGDDGVIVTETFEIEDINPAEMQRAGWQSILDNFARYTEAHS